MGRRLEFTVPAEVAGTRLDRCLSRLIPDSSRAYLQKLIKSGAVRCDGEVCTVPRQPVAGGMRVEVDLPEVVSDDSPPAAEPFAFDILYEDAWMLVIDKPAGVVVHPAAVMGHVHGSDLPRQNFDQRRGEKGKDPGDQQGRTNPEQDILVKNHRYLSFGGNDQGFATKPTFLYTFRRVLLAI